MLSPLLSKWLRLCCCGQELEGLLRRLKAQGSRALIFTQMARMLDILEVWLNLHAFTYLRLDGSTKPEQRQALMQQFNASPKVLVFILSTRSGGALPLLLHPAALPLSVGQSLASQWQQHTCCDTDLRPLVQKPSLLHSQFGRLSLWPSKQLSAVLAQQMGATRDVRTFKRLTG